MKEHVLCYPFSFIIKNISTQTWHQIKRFLCRITTSILALWKQEILVKIKLKIKRLFGLKTEKYELVY